MRLYTSRPMKSAAEPMLPARLRQRGRGVGRERIVHRDVRREGRGEQEHRHDDRAGRAERIAADEEAHRAPAGADIGAGCRQFGLKSIVLIASPVRKTLPRF